MRRMLWQRILVFIVLVLPISLTGMAAAAATPDYSITYTITVADDGSALWRVEYRTLLLSDNDVTDFETYARDIPAVYLPQFRELMVHSAAQAAVATGRHMEITGVIGDAVMQESPTGRYGVVVYTARWNGFARPGATITIGDAFAGGLYLEKDNTLVIRYPEGYTVARIEPEPDNSRDGLVWYGQRSFGAGEPRVVLEQPAFPLLPVAAGLVLVIVIAFTGFAFYRRRTKSSGNTPDEPLTPSPLTETELMSFEDRIVQLLRSHDGELFQSDIVKVTGLPKSTVSTVLNDLHACGMIIKVKKGRENLIRLAPGTPPDAGR
ncbi:MAG: helix-turn-helix domain-containing protein [Methanoregula sp.]|nr:helix-turn-helix domain-containing protein [Methanoregula sp.]